MTVNQTIHQLRAALDPLYGPGEAKAIIRLIFHHLKDWEPTDIYIHSEDEVSPYIASKIEEYKKRLLEHEPIQYITGEATFRGLRMHVEPGVLIPRPETEGLVDLICDQYGSQPDLRVLDIGTGSGCIAIALARWLVHADVTGIDISERALDIAKRNAFDLKVGISLRWEDIFTWSPKPRSFDIIVSNPPYIPEADKRDMDANVLNYEPKEALFVPDEHPLMYYSRIADVAADALADGGRLYLEINAPLAKETAALVEKAGLRDVEIRKDMFGRDRYVIATK